MPPGAPAPPARGSDKASAARSMDSRAETSAASSLLASRSPATECCLLPPGDMSAEPSCDENDADNKSECGMAKSASTSDARASKSTARLSSSLARTL